MKRKRPPSIYGPLHSLQLLELEGAFICRLAYVGSVIDSRVASREDVSTAVGWPRICPSYSDFQRQSTPSVPVAKPDVAFFQQVTCRTMLPHSVHFRSLVEHSTIQGTYSIEHGLQKVEPKISPLERSIGRRIAVSEEGQSILVPALTEPGDQVVARFGLRLPFLIRLVHQSATQEK